MLKRLFGWLFNPWLLLALGVLALALVIWIVGPLVAIGALRPLETETARWIAIGVVVGLIVLRKLWQVFAARRTNDKVVNQLMAAPAGAAQAEDGELKILAERFATALQTLKNAKFDRGASGPAAAVSSLSSRLGKRYLYELPWYVIIGAPGSGKTTALINSGLHFPLAATLGEHKFRGVGGTRNCDWWFTDEAVLIDTAGRYTTQDSDRSTDSKAWEGFLGLLKSSRPRQPLNGVLVTVSVPDLLTRSPAERAEQAAAVRQRVQELHQQLRMRFPIYLLVTKCDLLAGFTDYLGSADKDTRATPWGFTFRMDKTQRTDVNVFAAEFDALERRLTDGLIDRLQLERDAQRRARIYAFPQQFDGLRGVLHEFVEHVFGPSQFEAHPLLRGVYFVSGTQEGTPIDRMLGSIARTYGLERSVLPAHEGAGKSFFLSRLLREVVFAESALAGTDLKWERRRGWLAAAGYGTVGAVAVLALAAWITSYLNNRDYVAKVGAAVDDLRKLVDATPNRVSPDLAVLLPALEATRNLARAGIGESAPLSYRFGLYQGRKLDSASRQAYQRMLSDAVLPRLALRVEEQLKTGAGNPEMHYEALKAYVMLYDPARFDAAALKLYVMADWEANLSRDISTEQRAALESHLDALLAEGQLVSPLQEDKNLVAQTRARLASTPLPERAYRRLKRQGIGGDIEEFTIAKKAGSGAALAFRRASGAPLTKGVAGMFTHAGYHKAFQREVSRLSGQLADEEGWVLGIAEGSRASSLRDPMAQQRLADEVRRLYLTEYAQVWEAFIADVKLLPTADLAQAVQMARVLSAPENPLVPLLKAMSHETTLGDSKDLTAKVESKARESVNKAREELGRLIGDKPQAGAVARGARIESIVDDRFSGLRQLVTAPGGQGPAPIDATVALINEVYTQLSAADTAVKGGNAPPPTEVPNKVKAEAARMPEPLRSALTTLSVSGTTAALQIAQTHLGQAINAQIGEFCRQATSGRYPFVRSSARDVTQEDFARLFAPGGLFDAFFTQQLLPYVDTSTRPWSFKKVGVASMGGGGSTLQQFQNAAAIRETFFRAGGAAPGLRLDFKPLELDTTITQFILDVDGQLVKYAHGPQIPASIQWPGPRGSTQVRVALSPVSATGKSGTVDEGPWALFRLFDRLQLESAGAPERFRATFNIEGRKAVFDITASSVRNPFRLRELEDFSCPAKL